MIYTLFDKYSSSASISDGAGTRANKSAIKSEVIPKQQLAEEIHKPIIRNYVKRKVYISFKKHICGADLKNM